MQSQYLKELFTLTEVWGDFNCSACGLRVSQGEETQTELAEYGLAGMCTRCAGQAMDRMCECPECGTFFSVAGQTDDQIYQAEDRGLDGLCPTCALAAIEWREMESERPY